MLQICAAGSFMSVITQIWHGSIPNCKSLSCHISLGLPYSDALA